jgi:solute carrier family 6 GABA transporter-like protein 1
MSTENQTQANNDLTRPSTFPTGPSPGNDDKDRWPSRTAFYLAALGSAVGFGNVWRFPALVKDYGGGAFFIPFLLALFFVGLPVLILEISLGQYHQSGNVSVFGSFHARFRGVGIASVACAYVLVVYYSILLAWVCRAFFQSWGEEAPWSDEGVTGEQAVSYFYGDIIGMSTLGEDLRPTRVVWPNVGYSALVWLCIFACLAFGMKWTGRVAYITMGLPIVLLFLFLGKAVSLPGAEEGIQEYIGKFDVSVLTERPDVWSTAVSQVFFSLSICFGTMTAYGASCPRGEPAFMNSVVVGISDLLFSFLSGFAVFAALGHLSYVSGVPVNEVPYSGFSLVFGTWPVVFGTLQGGEHWVRLLFFDLFLLGIDSAFSILEGPVTVAMDWLSYNPSRKIPKWQVVGVFTISTYLLSFIYATDAGLIFLDTVDFYINFVLLMIGFFETFGAGWVYGIEDQIRSLGAPMVAAYLLTNFTSIFVACGLWFGLKDNAVWGGFLGLFLVWFTGILVVFFMMRQKMAEESDKWTWSSIIYELCFSNVFAMRNELVDIVGYIPRLWALGLKYFIPQILLILFINLARSTNEDGELLLGHYGGYVTWPFQVLGMLCVAWVFIILLVGFASPGLFERADVSARVKQIQKTYHEADSTSVAGVDTTHKTTMEQTQDAKSANSAEGGSNNEEAEVTGEENA